MIDFLKNLAALVLLAFPMFVLFFLGWAFTGQWSPYGILSFPVAMAYYAGMVWALRRLFADSG